MERINWNKEKEQEVISKAIQYGGRLKKEWVDELSFLSDNDIKYWEERERIRSHFTLSRLKAEYLADLLFNGCIRRFFLRSSSFFKDSYSFKYFIKAINRRGGIEQIFTDTIMNARFKSKLKGKLESDDLSSSSKEGQNLYLDEEWLERGD